MITGDVAQAGAYIGAGLATIGMGGSAIGVGIVVGSAIKASMKYKNEDKSTMFVGIAFAEALGIFAFLVALLLNVCSDMTCHEFMQTACP